MVCSHESEPAAVMIVRPRPLALVPHLEHLYALKAPSWPSWRAQSCVRASFGKIPWGADFMGHPSSNPPKVSRAFAVPNRATRTRRQRIDIRVEKYPGLRRLPNAQRAPCEAPACETSVYLKSLLGACARGRGALRDSCNKCRHFAAIHHAMPALADALRARSPRRVNARRVAVSGLWRLWSPRAFEAIASV